MRFKNFFRLIFVLMATFCLMIFVGCKKEEQTNVSDVDTKPIIAVTIVPEETFVKKVCGDNFDVVTLVPPGNSPGNYEPTPKEMQKFSKASLYFTIGVPTEEANILPNTGDVKIVDLAKKVSDVYPDRTFESGARDPHIWLSPKRVKIMIETIKKELIEIDNENKDIYEKNAQRYLSELDMLDKDITSSLRNFENMKFIAYHPSFGYFADDYGLTMYSLELNGKEATAKHLQEMVDLAKEENIKAVFYQEEIDSSQSKSFAEEIGGKTTQLAPLAPDYIDNLKKMAQAITEVK